MLWHVMVWCGMVLQYGMVLDTSVTIVCVATVWYGAVMVCYGMVRYSIARCARLCYVILYEMVLHRIDVIYHRVVQHGMAWSWNGIGWYCIGFIVTC